MKKLNTKEIQNRLADLNEQRQRIENIMLRRLTRFVIKEPL